MADKPKSRSPSPSRQASRNLKPRPEPSNSNRRRSSVKVNLSGEEVDMLLDRMRAKKAHLDATNTGVKRRAIEPELVLTIEEMSKIMQQTVSRRDNSLLLKLFGGECHRIAQIRTLCEGTNLSAQHASKLQNCMAEVAQVEKALQAAGLEEQLLDALKKVTDGEGDPTDEVACYMSVVAVEGQEAIENEAAGKNQDAVNNYKAVEVAMASAAKVLRKSVSCLDRQRTMSVENVLLRGETQRKQLPDTIAEEPPFQQSRQTAATLSDSAELLSAPPKAVKKAVAAAGAVAAAAGAATAASDPIAVAGVRLPEPSPSREAAVGADPAPPPQRRVTLNGVVEEEELPSPESEEVFSIAKGFSSKCLERQRSVASVAIAEDAETLYRHIEKVRTRIDLLEALTDGQKLDLAPEEFFEQLLLKIEQDPEVQRKVITAVGALAVAYGVLLCNPFGLVLAASVAAISVLNYKRVPAVKEHQDVAAATAQAARQREGSFAASEAASEEAHKAGKQEEQQSRELEKLTRKSL